jgi:serine/threonine protein kinase/Flp pilus assembly protein TadD
MTAPYRSLKELFLAALDVAPEGRAAWLECECAADAGVREQLRLMLAAHDAPQSLLDRPAGVLATCLPPGGVGPTGDQPVAEGPGTVLGPYKLLEQIGEGGMGLVFMAEQTRPVRRKVALKILKPGMDTRQVVARFEAERQALALMDHPNIAKIHDAGTTATGRPYFVMELVRGVPITEFCDQRRLTPRQRLELFVLVCQAVQHAHQKGIIHRDLKPSNVLVTLHDVVAVPKVIDFGIAKATGQRLTEHTLFTHFAQMVGTPLYMSPEQAGLSGLDVDTRSDVYALGVLLYELLTGTTPFEKERLRHSAYDEILRIIREEEAPKPSTRVSTLGRAAPTVAEQRQVDPKRLGRLLRGELDWIVLKALEKDRARRYATAQELADDLLRYLDDEPILARPPTPAYRARKWARRHRAVVWAASVTLVLGAVFGGGTWFWWAQKRATAEGEARVALLEAASLGQEEKWPEALSAVGRARGALAGVGAGPGPWRQIEELGKDLEMGRRLEEARLRMEEPDREGRFNLEASDAAYAAAFGEYGLDVQRLDPREAAERILGRSIQPQLVGALDDWALLRRQLKGEGWRRLVAIARVANPDRWRDRLRDALEAQDPKALEELAAAAPAGEWPATTLVLLARLSQGTPVDERVVGLLRQARQRHPADFWINQELASLLRRLRPPRTEEAIRYLTAAVALRPHNPGVHVKLGNLLRDQGDLEGAIAECQEAIRLRKDYAPAHHLLAKALNDKGLLDQAVAASREAIRLNKDDAEAHCDLGNALWRQRRLDDAVAAYREAILLEKDYALAHNNLGTALYDMRRLEESIAEFQKAIDLDKDLALAHRNLGVALRDKGRLDEAIAELRKATDLKGDDPEAYNKLGNALMDNRQPDAAIDAYREALRIKKDFYQVRYNLANALKQNGQLNEAVAQYRKVIRAADDFAEAHCNLGRALMQQGKFREAAAALRRGHELGSQIPHWPYPSAQWVGLAERLAELEPRLPRLLEGRDQPADAAERLTLADYCQQSQQRYAAAARWYAEAFAADPMLPADPATGRRYDAACAAALAGCGQGRDSLGLGETERLRLRGQVLDWLRADLEAWHRALAKAPDEVRPVVSKTMRHWLRDADFAGVRDQEALARLPEAERQEWQQLWANVEALRRRAAEPPKPENSGRP